MRVAGIDLSTRALHIVTLPFEPPDNLTDLADVELVEVPLAGVTSDPAGNTWFYVCRRVRRRLEALTDWAGVVLVFVERPVGPGRDKLLPLFGAIVAAIPDRLVVSYLAPQEWRRVFVGAGNASKGAARGKALMLAYPRDWPDDAYDALGVCWAGRELNRQGIVQAEAAA